MLSTKARKDESTKAISDKEAKEFAFLPFRAFVPFSKSLLWTVKALFGSSILWMLLSIYGDFSTSQALPVSLIYIFITVSCTVFYKYSVKYLKEFTAIIKIFFILFSQIIPFLLLFLICSLFGIISPSQFLRITPLITVFGLMFFAILILSDKKKHLKNESIEEKKEELPEPIQQKKVEIKKNEVDRISVKNQSEIHVLKVEEIFYIEAYGDYVLIYTEKEKYIKEQTMQYFESILPTQFLRIHRSYIVNTDYMIRLELFGKESYITRLKNGVRLKASKSGYKLMKEKLGL